jgi:multiphosphoryl transfer protein
VNLRSPLAGWCSSLDEAPDEVFAGRLLGDGLLIDPTGHELFAPCDGEIISVATSKHAIAIRSREGVEILMHVGIDTVNLAGAGFEVFVTPGMQVAAGAKLLAFDLEFLARRAKSLATPIIITNSEHADLLRAEIDRELAVGDPLMEIRVKGQIPSRNEMSGGSWSEAIRIEHAHGIHARPAALIANAAKKLQSKVEIRAHGRTANAASPVALMSLGVRADDEVTVHATGQSARDAVAAIKHVIATLAHHEEHRTEAVQSKPIVSRDPARLRGVIASRGVAIGRAFHLRRPDIEVPQVGGSTEYEAAELVHALADVRARLAQLASSASRTTRDVIEAHLELLEDPELLEVANRSISTGDSAAYAWRHAIRSFADQFRSLGDARMAERVDDLLDLEHQVLAALLHIGPSVQMQTPEQSVLIATDLQPSQFVSLDKTNLAAICLAAGGPTSHVAILAAAIGIPTLVALGECLDEIASGAPLIVDAEQGLLHVTPSEAELASTSQMLAARQQHLEAQRMHAQRDCHTADGARIEVFANLGSLEDAMLAIAQGAEGCGLLRTEFLFLDREHAPDELEQARCYQEIATELIGRPLIIRTLDVGGDKPIPYLPLPTEDNPALGLRGIRTSLWQIDLLRTQLRAILRVQPQGQCRVLVPMITDVEEVRTVRALLEKLRLELALDAAPAMGIMIETPASAVLSEQLAREVDFFSIGTNDLTQYTLAMDRGHAELASRIDGLHPAVLKLIALTCEAAAKHQRLVAVCGGLASDPVAVPVLLGLGVGELSAVPAVIPQIKHLIGSWTLDECRALAQRALQLESAEAVRALLKGAQISKDGRTRDAENSASVQWG